MLADLPELVREINLAGGANPSDLTEVNGTIYFVADTAGTGRELWKSDGTSARTEQVIDLNPRASSSTPMGITNIAGVVYFAANDGTAGNEPWSSGGSSVTNGSENGTQSVTATITNDDPIPAVTLSLANGTLVENRGVGTVTATLANPPYQDATVNLSFSGVATFGSDDTSADNIVIPAGQTSASINITSIHDTTYDTNESIVVDVGGRDQFTMIGSNNVVETVTINPASLTYSSTHLTVQSDAEVEFAFGQSNDSATLNDSAGNDVHFMRREYGYMFDRTNSYLSQPIGFGSVVANALGGSDQEITYIASGRTPTMTPVQSSGSRPPIPRLWRTTSSIRWANRSRVPKRST